MITVRPLVLLNGHRHFNDVFFDNVVVPKEHLVDPKDQGWKVASATASSAWRRADRPRRIHVDTSDATAASDETAGVMSTEGFDRFRAEVEQQLQRFVTELQQAIGGVETRLTARMDGVERRREQRIDGVETRLEQRIGGVETRLEQRIDGVETRLEQRIGGVETRLEQRIDTAETALRQEIAAASAADRRHFGVLLESMQSKVSA